MQKLIITLKTIWFSVPNAGEPAYFHRKVLSKLRKLNRKSFRIEYTILTLAIVFQLGAAPVSADRAEKAARSWYLNSVRQGSSAVIESNWAAESTSGAAYYVFNFQAGGFVIISGDDTAEPVLGYSENGELNQNFNHPLLENWLAAYTDQINQLTADRSGNFATAPGWQELLNGNLRKSGKAVLPKLRTTWHQAPYYNMYCPKKNGTLTVTGCTATAAAQLLKFWNHPATGIGEYSYNWDMDDNNSATNQQIKTAFDSAFCFESMPDKLQSSTPLDQKQAVAKLSYRVGAAIGMDYGVNGSAANLEWLLPALKNYFKYDRNLNCRYLSNYTSAEWLDMLKNELDAGRPLLYTGREAQGGHTFVLDGYDESVPAKFHINWGWGGSGDGYFAIGALNPNGMGFNQLNRAIFGLQPATGLNCIIASPADSSAAPAGQEIEIKVHAFNDSSLIDGVDFYVDGEFKSSDLQTPFSFNFNTGGLVTGYHNFKAVARSTNGTTATDQIAVYISFGSWQIQSSSFTTAGRMVDNIYIVNEEIAWATASDANGTTLNEFTKTVNGGTTWTAIENKIPYDQAQYGLTNLSVIDANLAWAALYPQGNATADLGIYKTADGGNSWNHQSSANFGAASFPDFVHIFDFNCGICVGDPVDGYFEIYRTENGGTDWNRIPQSSIAAGTASATGEYGNISLFDAVGDTVWFLSNAGNVFKSSNRGLTWTITAGAAPGCKGGLQIKFLNGSDGLMSYYTGSDAAPVFKLRRSSDGGLSWSDLNPNGSFSFFNLAPVRGSVSEWVSVSAAQNNSFSSYSFDNGANWVNLDNGTPYTAVSLLNRNTGWAGGINQDAVTGGIYKWSKNGTEIFGEESFAIPQNALLAQNYPNPFNPSTVIEFSLKGSSQISLTVYDALGREVAKVAEGRYAAGKHTVQFNALHLSAGIYFYSLKAAGQTAEVRKMILCK